jgi:hypothetical protein
MNKIGNLLLLTNLLLCPAIADVSNESQETIYLKTESSDRTFPLEPGRTYNGRQDGLVVQGARKGQVYKVVDNINVIVGQNYSIETFASLSLSTLDKIQATVEQAIKGGWKDKRFNKNHPDWNQLFEQSN